MTALGLGDHDNPAMSSPGSTGRPSTPCAIERSKTKLDTFTPKVLTQAGLAGQRLGVRDPISESPEKGVPIPIRGCGMDFGAPSLRTGRADFADPRLRNPACSLLGPRSMFRGAIGCFRHTQGGRRRRAGAGGRGGARVCAIGAANAGHPPRCRNFTRPWPSQTARFPAICPCSRKPF